MRATIRTLDVVPSPRQRWLLEQLAQGRALVLTPSDHPVIAQRGEAVPRATVTTAHRRQWIDRPPGRPLFDPPVAITERGIRALTL